MFRRVLIANRGEIARRLIRACHAAGAEAVAAAGLTGVGPPPGAMRAMADKVDARRLVAAAGVPVVPGSDGPVDPDTAPAVARELGYPLMCKAAKGGGGIGMAVVRDEAELLAALETAR